MTAAAGRLRLHSSDAADGDVAPTLSPELRAEIRRLFAAALKTDYLQHLEADGKADDDETVQSPGRRDRE